MMRAFKYRLYPNKTQIKALSNTLTTCRTLYNHALQHRRKNYEEHRISISCATQDNILLADKEEYDLEVHSQVLQNALKRLDTSYANFFRRVKQKRGKAGFPRFKGRNSYKSFTYPQSGFELIEDNRRIRLSQIGDVRIVYSRPIQGIIKTCCVKREVDKWFVILTCEILPKADEEPVRIDLTNAENISVG